MKTIEKITKNLVKMADQLDKFATTKEQEYQKLSDTALEIQRKADIASSEAMRATTISIRIANLLGE